jgi:hypothetical protein
MNAQRVRTRRRGQSKRIEQLHPPREMLGPYIYIYITESKADLRIPRSWRNGSFITMRIGNSIHVWRTATHTMRKCMWMINMHGGTSWMINSMRKHRRSSMRRRRRSDMRRRWMRVPRWHHVISWPM